MCKSLSSKLIPWLPALLILSGSACTAKDSPHTVAIGDTIRFTARAMGFRNQIGIVADQVGDSIYVRVEDKQHGLLLQRDQLQRLQVRRGDRKTVGESMVIWGLMGAMVGATPGVIRVMRKEPQGNNKQSNIGAAATGALAGFAVGAVVFGIGYGEMHTRPNWITVAPWTDDKPGKKSFGLVITKRF